MDFNLRFLVLVIAQLYGLSFANQPHHYSIDDHSHKVAKLSSRITKQCHEALHQNQTDYDLNIFAYGCFLKKNFTHTQIPDITKDFGLCCTLWSTKCEEDLDCPNRFCECLDMINVVYKPFLPKECGSSQLKICEKTSSILGHDDKEFRDDVGFVIYHQGNWLLGGWGITCFALFVIFSFCGFIYLCFICITYRCCSGKQHDDEDPGQFVYPDQDGEARGDLTTELSLAQTTTPQILSQTLPSQTQTQSQIGLPGSGGPNTGTMTKDITNTLSMEL